MKISSRPSRIATILLFVGGFAFIVSTAWIVGVSSSLDRVGALPAQKRDLHSISSIVSARNGHYWHDWHVPATAFQSPLQDNTQYDFTVAICLITRDGEAYFQEWVDYHLLAMQFDAIYVYDNSEKFDLKRWYENSRGHPIYNSVEIHHKPGPGYMKEENKFLQSIVYEDCIKQYGKDPNGSKHDYFALIDIDEFLVPQTGKYKSIHAVLADYLVPFGGALVSNWALFGSANRTVYSAVPVTKRFQYRDAEVNNVIKSIVKATDYRGNRNPHAVKLNKPENIHTSEFPGAIQANVFNTTDRRKASSWVKAADVLLVHHYRYTSDKEYYYKRCVRDGLMGHWCNKSKGTIKDRTPDHVQSRPGEVFDDKAWRLLTAKVPKYHMYETLEWEDLF